MLATMPTSRNETSPLYYVDTGSGEPVVLLHGLGCDHRTWDGVRPELASKGWRVLTPDLPGHGKSPKPWRSYRLTLYTDYLIRWLETLETGLVHLIGHSLGGALAAAIAMERPDLVRSVGAVCSIRLVNHTPPTPVLLTFMAFGIAQLFGQPSVRATRRFLERGLGCNGTATPEMIQLFRETAGSSTRAVLSSNRQLRRPEASLYDRLEQLHCPVWLLWGKRDPLFPGVDPAAWVAERLPKAALEFTDTGHLPMFERPDEFVKRLMGHLMRVSDAQAHA